VQARGIRARKLSFKHTPRVWTEHKDILLHLTAQLKVGNWLRTYAADTPTTAAFPFLTKNIFNRSEPP
jgi:hypothetical protein